MTGFEFSTDEDDQILAEIAFEEKDKINHQTALNKEDMLRGEIEMLRTNLNSKSNELEKLNEKLAKEQEDIANKINASEQKHDVELKNLKTQLIFKEQELNEAKRSFKVVEEKLKHSENKYQKLSTASIAKGNFFARKSSTNSSQSSLEVQKSLPKTQTENKINPQKLSAIESCLRKILIGENILLGNHLLELLTRRQFGTQIHFDLMLLLIGKLTQLLQIQKYHDITLLIKNTLKCENSEISILNNNTNFEDYKVDNELYSNFDYLDSKQKLLLFLKQQLRCIPLDKNLLKIVGHLSKYKDNEFLQILIDEIDCVAIHSNAIRNLNFDNYIALINTQIKFRNFPCTSSERCYVNGILNLMQNSDIKTIHNILDLIISMLTCQNYGPQYILEADCICNINLYQSIVGMLHMHLNDIDKLYSQIMTIFSFCLDSNMKERLNGSMEQFIPVYFQLINNSQTNSIFKSILEKMWVFDIAPGLNDFN